MSDRYSKRRETNLTRYGNPFPANGGSAKMKSANTLKNNYNVDNPMKSKEVRNRVTKTWINKLQRTNTDDRFINHLSSTSLEIYRLDNDFANKWLNEHHPEGSGKGALLCFGLVKNETVYCIMTFRRPINKKYNTQLLRMWMLPGYYVDGGYDLLSRYASAFGLYNIVAYANPKYEDVSEYEKIGMSLVRLRNGKVIYEYLTPEQ